MGCIAAWTDLTEKVNTILFILDLFSFIDLFSDYIMPANIQAVSVFLFYYFVTWVVFDEKLALTVPAFKLFVYAGNSDSVHFFF